MTSTNTFADTGYTIRWYNDERSILYGRIFKRWTWDEAYPFLEEINQTVRSVDHEVYTILHFDGKGDNLPAHFALPNLKRLLQPEDPPNERMTIIVSSSNVLRVFITTAGVVNNFTDKVTRHHYVKTLNDALRLIKQAQN